MEAFSSRFLRPVVVAIVIGSILLSCFKIISYGYLPVDDALRHAAKVVSGKDWHEIVVMRPGITTDRHEGWHAFLTAVYHVTGCSKEGLVVFSILFLGLLFLLSPVPWLSRPEIWPIIIAFAVVLAPVTMGRTLYGRPYIFPMAVLLTLCFIWPRLESPRLPVGTLSLVVLLLAVSTLVHGLPHLYLLPVLAFFMARRWVVAARFAGATALGVALGATLTGHPIRFLWEGWLHSSRAFTDIPLQSMLVFEFQAFPGETVLLLAILLALIWRRVRGEWDSQQLLQDPVFMLMCLGWVLGFAARRFWMDWGFVAALAWLAKELDAVANRRLPSLSHQRLVIAFAGSLFLYLSLTNDLGGRWTSNLTKHYLSLQDPSEREWLPEPGGIVYSDTNAVFFDTFYANPGAPWRYLLAFEPTLMPDEDLKIWYRIQWNRGAYPAFAPWVNKMKPADRLIIERASLPSIPRLEWANPALNIWVGRLPRINRTAAGASQGRAREPGRP